MKKINNKGFSLVELIIVIAIMAILVGVMTPQLLRWIEKSKYASDIQTISTIEGAIKIAMVDCSLAGYAVPSGTTLTLSDVFEASNSSTEFVAILTETLEGQSTFTFESKAFDGAFGSLALVNHAGSQIKATGSTIEVLVTSSNPTDYPDYKS